MTGGRYEVLWIVIPDEWIAIHLVFFLGDTRPLHSDVRSKEALLQPMFLSIWMIHLLTTDHMLRLHLTP